jgi:hypothetical protein
MKPVAIVLTIPAYAGTATLALLPLATCTVLMGGCALAAHDATRSR